jgi:proline iminopeptidase
MKKRRLCYALSLVVLAGLVCLSCAPLDVRMGMGDGDGVRLSYRVVGEGRPLVVIHDGPGYEKSLMYKAFDALAGDMKVVYYDQRGCGRSQALTPMISSSIADNVNDLEALRQYLNLERFSIAAHGWGAVIALEYARKYAEHIDSIVLITPISPFAPEPTHMRIMDSIPAKTRLEIDELINHPILSLLDKRERVMRLSLPALFHNQDAVRHVRLSELRLAPEVNLRLGTELATLDLFPALGEVALPTLVIIGRHDVATPVRDQMAYADGIVTSSAVVFNDSGHFPFLEEPGFFITVVKEFLHSGRVPALVSALDFGY